MNTKQQTMSLQKASWMQLTADKTVAEFFAGIGLMREGLERAGWSVRFANDIAPEKRDMYKTHFTDPSDHFLLEDVHVINAKEVPTITLATASFPCNDLSLAGSRKGLNGEQSSAYWGFVHILKKMGDRRPPLVLLENVAGFLTSHGGRDLQEALLALNELGYAVDVIIIDAERFVPQSRVRLFVIGSMQGAGKLSESSETSCFYESDARPKAVANFIFEHPEIRWRLQALPSLPKRDISLDDLLEKLPEDSPLWWSRERADYLVNQMSEKHAATLRKMMNQRRWSFGTVFRRVRSGKSMAELRNDGVAGCLRTPRGGSGRQILVQAGYGKVRVRLLTPRECARLMGADDFTIEISSNKALFGFGDAVCVPVVTWIAQFYLDPLLEALQKRTHASCFSQVGPGLEDGYAIGGNC